MKNLEERRMPHEDRMKAIDVMGNFRTSYLGSHDRRRELEWKISFGIWTMLATVTGILLTQPINFRVAEIQYFAAGFALLVFVTHLSVIIGIYRQNIADKAVARYYAERIAKELGFSLHTSELKRPEHWLLNSRVAQIVITGLLCVALVSALLLRKA